MSSIPEMLAWAGRSRIEIRYRPIVARIYHADIIIVDENGARAYWAGPKYAVHKFAPPFSGTTIGYFQDKSYSPSSRFFVKNSNFVQVVFHEAAACLSTIEAQIVNTLREIDQAEIPYSLRGPNSNSVAFQVLRSLKIISNLTPPKDIVVPAWQMNPFDHMPVKNYFSFNSSAAYSKSDNFLFTQLVHWTGSIEREAC